MVSFAIEKYFHSVKSMSRSAGDPHFGTRFAKREILAPDHRGVGKISKNLVRKFALVDLRS